MATKKNCIKVILTLIKKVVTKILAFGNPFKTIGVSMVIKSYILEFGNHGNNKNSIKAK